jgi:hypothetical protein
MYFIKIFNFDKGEEILLENQLGLCLADIVHSGASTCTLPTSNTLSAQSGGNDSGM